MLTVARHFFQSFAKPQSEGWIRALAAAEQRFRPGMHAASAADMAVRLLAALQELRAARTSGFRFSNPDCPGCAARLTEQERQFMDVLIALRRGKRSKAHAAAMMLCEGNPTDSFLRAMADLAALTIVRAPA
ncbi:hypothetical protein DSD19_14860 [Rhodovulum sp. BSW8]|nr:hypothetical protein [Rhodovulum visakhapatnamense]MBL3578713.1 hypothetical protein [Rhodovulum visakhapatnamense]OLS46572.1 hypothetical protein BV509_03160 [Rhodovulum sulfidophilum]RBO52495.1 hypothetical protein DSD19_14860 [Rhodovulum sp. BSW8]